MLSNVLCCAVLCFVVLHCVVLCFPVLSCVVLLCCVVSGRGSAEAPACSPSSGSMWSSHTGPLRVKRGDDRTFTTACGQEPPPLPSPSSVSSSRLPSSHSALLRSSAPTGFLHSTPDLHLSIHPVFSSHLFFFFSPFVSFMHSLLSLYSQLLSIGPKRLPTGRSFTVCRYVCVLCVCV